MIARIDVLLCRWGRWASAHARRDIGYASISPMFRDVGDGAYGSSIPAGVGDIDITQIDKAVSSLPDVQRIVVISHYQMGSSFRETANRCGIKRGLLNKFLSEAHASIDKWLSYDHH
jgi:hypothetical protein